MTFLSTPSKSANPPARAAFPVLEAGVSWADATGVLIAMHGRDREASELAERLAPLAGKAGLRIVAPIAPERSWYPARYDAPTGNEGGLNTALAQIDLALATAGARGIGPQQAILVGFSQGACVVARYVLDRDAVPAGAAIFTGAALPLQSRRHSCAGARILLTGGEQDPWLPIADLHNTAAAFVQAGAEVRCETFPDADHVVRQREVDLLEEFVEHMLIRKQ